MLSEENRQKAEGHIRSVLELLGHDITAPDLVDTPKRFTKLLEEFSGSHPMPKLTTFPADTRGLVVQTGIPFSSLCAHHLAAFNGFATIGYLPSEQMLGLSKFKRIVDRFAKNLQNQERLTEQVANFIYTQFRPHGVGVILVATHNCMQCRGVEVSDVWTTTTRLLGRIADDAQTRAEFLAHHKHR
jgi:GTP cyclohydrolase I